MKEKSREVRAHFRETAIVFRSPWLSAYPERALTLDPDFNALEDKNEIEISVTAVVVAAIRHFGTR